ncbi:peptidyl-tRNA hydrolase [Neoconidiobolus thromboides FSU 785]|nr:peptidyl-tRNA hydrolase [Neoconidiobolus thromboides FSU 785]
MNLSGISVKASMKSEKLNKNQLLVLQDDLERDLGKFSLKLKGSANGHNGISSIIKCLNVNEFARLRIGISRPESRDKDVIANYVLENFTYQERKIIDEQLYPNLVHYILDYLKGVKQ